MIYGILLCIALAIISILLSQYIFLGAVAVAIILGAIVSNTTTLPTKFNSGIGFSEKKLLALSIALMGINLDFVILGELGVKTIFIVIFSLIATIVFSFYVAKKMSFSKDFTLILGIGNGVCGTAAIAATKDIVKLDQQKSAIAIAIINLLGTIALFTLPLVGVLLGFSDTEIGIFLGNTLQSVGHVVGAAYGVNETVGQSATIVKMGRILLLTPIIFWLIYYVSKVNTTIEKESKRFEIPGFIIGFILFSIVASIDLLPLIIEQIISMVSKYSLIIAMAAIGLRISFKTLKEHGSKAFIVAGTIFKFQILLSMILISLL